MNYKNSENETLNTDDARIRALLGDLRRIDAPADFDFRLKARISRAKSNDYNAAPQMFPQVLRYVLPLGLVILVSAFVVFNGVYFRSEQSVGIAENHPQTSATESASNKSGVKDAPQTAEIIPPLPKDAETANGSGAIKIRETNKRTSANSPLVASSGGKREARNSSGKNADKNNEGGSRESASTAPKITAPPGINPNQMVQTSPNPEGGKSLTAKEILAQLGIEAVFANESWKVKSVGQNSLAERSGVKTGDAVEAIDGEKLTDKPLKRNTIEGKKLTITRDKQKIEISLGNQQN